MIRTVHYRRWSPQRSPVSVEFPASLLHEIRKASGRAQSRGYLYGFQKGTEIRAVDVRATQPEPVGIYITRPRGEVFLTDDDIAEMDRTGAPLALVVAGNLAGFFPREDGGKIQAVQSYEEFTVAEAAAEPDPSARMTPRTKAASRHPALPPVRAWKRVLAAAALLAVPAGGFAYLEPLLPKPPVVLSLRERGGHLTIRWDPKAITSRGALEITDLGVRKLLALEPGSASATYAPESGDVEIRLTTPEQSGTARWKSSHFISPIERVVLGLDQLDAKTEIDTLEAQAGKLRALVARNRERANQLSAQTEQMVAHVTPVQ